MVAGANTHTWSATAEADMDAPGLPSALGSWVPMASGTGRETAGLRRWRCDARLPERLSGVAVAVATATAAEDIAVD